MAKVQAILEVEVFQFEIAVTVFEVVLDFTSCGGRFGGCSSSESSQWSHFEQSIGVENIVRA